MVSKLILVVIAVALIVHFGTAQLGCGCNAGFGLGLAGNGLGLAGNGLGLSSNSLGLANNAQSICRNAYVGNGGSLGVTTYSPIAPTGVTLLSENGIEGPLSLCGGLPVPSVAAFEGQLPSSGQAGVEYSCGNCVGITSEYGGLANGAALNAAGLGYGNGLTGYGSGLAGCGRNLNSGIGYAGGLAGSNTLGYGAGLGGRCGCGCRS